MPAIAAARAAHRPPDLRKGIAAMLVVGLLFVAMDTTAKLLSERFEPLFVVWARYAGQALGTLVIFAPRLGRLARSTRPGLQIVRSGLLFVATIFFFTGLAHLPVAQVQAIAQVAPLAIVALAALFLGERVGPWRWGAVAAGFVGALIIIRPGAEGFGWEAVLPLCGALCFAAYGVATRFLDGHDGIWTTFLYTGLVGAVAASLAVPFVWTTPGWGDLPLLIAIGALGAAGQGTLIFAMQFAAASTLAPFLYLNLVWAALLGFAVFGEVPDLATVAGALVIVGAGLLVRWREKVRARAAQAG